MLIDLSSLDVVQRQHWLTSTVAPGPIALGLIEEAWQTLLHYDHAALPSAG